MNKAFIENNIEGSYLLTNKAVDNIKQDESLNTNYLAKRFVEHIEVYRTIIDHLLVNKY